MYRSYIVGPPPPLAEATTFASSSAQYLNFFFAVREAVAESVIKSSQAAVSVPQAVVADYHLS